MRKAFHAIWTLTRVERCMLFINTDLESFMATGQYEWNWSDQSFLIDEWKVNVIKLSQISPIPLLISRSNLSCLHGIYRSRSSQNALQHERWSKLPDGPDLRIRYGGTLHTGEVGIVRAITISPETHELLRTFTNDCRTWPSRME
jgi:hypothetical protein